MDRGQRLHPAALRSLATSDVMIFFQALEPMLSTVHSIQKLRFCHEGEQESGGAGYSSARSSKQRRGQRAGREHAIRGVYYSKQIWASRHGALLRSLQQIVPQPWYDNVDRAIRNHRSIHHHRFMDRAERDEMTSKSVVGWCLSPVVPWSLSPPSLTTGNCSYHFSILLNLG